MRYLQQFFVKKSCCWMNKHYTSFSVSHIYTHTNNQTNSTVCNLQLISSAMCTKTYFLPGLTLIPWRFGRRQRLVQLFTAPLQAQTKHCSIASNLHRRITPSNENKIPSNRITELKTLLDQPVWAVWILSTYYLLQMFTNINSQNSQIHNYSKRVTGNKKWS